MKGGRGDCNAGSVLEMHGSFYITRLQRSRGHRGSRQELADPGLPPPHLLWIRLTGHPLCCCHHRRHHSRVPDPVSVATEDGRLRECVFKCAWPVKHRSQHRKRSCLFSRAAAFRGHMTRVARHHKAAGGRKKRTTPHACFSAIPLHFLSGTLSEFIWPFLIVVLPSIMSPISTSQENHYSARLAASASSAVSFYTLLGWAYAEGARLPGWLELIAETLTFFPGVSLGFIAQTKCQNQIVWENQIAPISSAKPTPRPLIIKKNPCLIPDTCLSCHSRDKWPNWRNNINFFM